MKIFDSLGDCGYARACFVQTDQAGRYAEEPPDRKVDVMVSGRRHGKYSEEADAWEYRFVPSRFAAASTPDQTNNDCYTHSHSSRKGDGLAKPDPVYSEVALPVAAARTIGYAGRAESARCSQVSGVWRGGQAMTCRPRGGSRGPGECPSWPFGCVVVC